MWIVFAFGSAFFAGVTAILAKCGVRKTDSDVATAVRTIVVLAFSWLMVFIVGSQDLIGEVNNKTLLFLLLSGLATGASWLCYFRALQLGDINKVVPIDKSSIVLTVIMAWIFLDEQINIFSGLGIAHIGAGTYFMIQKKEHSQTGVKDIRWLIYAALAAVFASLTAIFGKIGITDIESNLGTALRTIVVLIMTWLIVFIKEKQVKIKETPKRELMFILLSGIATGASWLCYYRALQDGPASVVVPIDKLSIVLTIIFSRVFLREKLSRKGFAGLAMIVVGTGCMLFG